MSLPRAVHEAVEAVAPIHGVSVPDEGDKSTWDVRYDNATPQQITAAAAAIDAFDVAAYYAAVAAETARVDSYSNDSDADDYDSIKKTYSRAEIEAYIDTAFPDAKQNKIIKFLVKDAVRASFSGR